VLSRMRYIVEWRGRDRKPRADFHGQRDLGKNPLRSAEKKTRRQVRPPWIWLNGLGIGMGLTNGSHTTEAQQECGASVVKAVERAPQFSDRARAQRERENGLSAC
jgi:hypothetical protein